MATRRIIRARAQIVAGLTAMRWTAPRIAKELGVSARTVHRSRAAVRQGHIHINREYIYALLVPQLQEARGLLGTLKVVDRIMSVMDMNQPQYRIY